jgi:hypothetical protein
MTMSELFLAQRSTTKLRTTLLILPLGCLQRPPGSRLTSGTGRNQSVNQTQSIQRTASKPSSDQTSAKSRTKP